MTLFVLFFPASGYPETANTVKGGKRKNDKSALLLPPHTTPPSSTPVETQMSFSSKKKQDSFARPQLRLHRVYIGTRYELAWFEAKKEKTE